MVYQSDELLQNVDYRKAFECVGVLNSKNKLVNKMVSSIDFVTYLMLIFNKHTGDIMIKHKNGIFRGTKNNLISNTDDKAPEELAEFLHIWKGMSGEYTTFDNIKPHMLLLGFTENTLPWGSGHGVVDKYCIATRWRYGGLHA